MEQIKALTIKQPWASLIALGEKQIESRTWKTKYRGTIAIHAGKGIDKDAYNRFSDILKKHGIQSIKDLPLGVVLATATIKDCRQVFLDYGNSAVLTAGGVIEGMEYRYGFYAEGNYGWELEGVKPLDSPVEAKGQLNLWNWQMPE